MERLQLAADGEHFTRGDKPFFWIADTVWSAFTNPTLEEWSEYLRFRKTQGFNVLQINTLPQWDRIQPDMGIYPYPLREDGSLDYTAAPNRAYFDRARTMCQMAVDIGFTPALVLCWANIVPRTWLARIFPTHVWPLDAVEAHVQRVLEAFDEYAPVYIISGDTDLREAETRRYYQRCIEILKEDAPNALLSMHLCGESVDLPCSLGEQLDFLMYQSGHGVNSVNVLEEMPTRLKQLFPGKPVLNAEPCYERMPKLSANMDEPPDALYSGQEVLDACRCSILAGAKAGITYGANGLWNWRREDGKPTGLAAKLYLYPCTWREALAFPGAEQIAALESLAYDKTNDGQP